MKGQASVEHFIIFGGALLVAMIAITILSAALGSSAEKLKAESDSYWSGASPFSISDATQPSNGSIVYLTVENRVPSYLTMHNLTLEFAGERTSNTTEKIFTNGMSVAMSVENPPANCLGREGSYAEYNIIISYDQNPLLGKVQEGAKPIYVRCT